MGFCTSIKANSLFKHKHEGEHEYLRVNIEGRVELKGPRGSLFRLPNGEGGTDLPTEDQFRDMVATGTFKSVSPPLPDAVRAKARKAQLNAEEVKSRAKDLAAAFRYEVITRWDKEQPGRAERKQFGKKAHDHPFPDMRSRGFRAVGPGSSAEQVVEELSADSG